MTAFVLLAALLAPPAPSPAAPAQTQTIVVTGRPLADATRALAECIARKCPPNEDIDRTLAVVETQFLAGHYAAARSVLNRAISRNARFAKDYPRPVADLYRVTGRVAIHLGEGEAYRRAVYGIGRSIRAGLPDDSVESLSADIETGEMNSGLGQYDRAQAVYGDVVKRARKANRPDIATMVQLRQAILRDSIGFTSDARRDLTAVVDATDPARRPFAMAARILLARLDRRAGRTDSTDAVIAAFARNPTPMPILIHDAPVGVGLGSGAVNWIATRSFDDAWGDFGFWIRPDGTVADIELLRHSENDPAWARPVLVSLAARRYTPFAAPDDNPGGAYHVERYTLTSLMMSDSRSRIRRHGPTARYERLDLAAEPPAPTPASPS
ncbi:hypothetical protein ACFSGX_15105 [Sphingomonas arantia]|uniref:Tetratricopeptide repeat protein n=1 Tax=Sphingomonas arantia TaxID=1460676 RepID=A0ABW4TZE1_9SPHN